MKKFHNAVSDSLADSLFRLHIVGIPESGENPFGYESLYEKEVFQLFLQKSLGKEKKFILSGDMSGNETRGQLSPGLVLPVLLSQ